jgi:hypothetical protein
LIDWIYALKCTAKSRYNAEAKKSQKQKRGKDAAATMMNHISSFARLAAFEHASALGIHEDVVRAQSQKARLVLRYVLCTYRSKWWMATTKSASLFDYKDEMCPSVSKLAHERSGAKVIILNECPHGSKCSFAHSGQEILYHPRRYKTRLC